MSPRPWLMGVPVMAQRCAARRWAAMADTGLLGLSTIWASSRHTRHQRSRVRAVGITCGAARVRGLACMPVTAWQCGSSAASWSLGLAHGAHRPADRLSCGHVRGDGTAIARKSPRLPCPAQSSCPPCNRSGCKPGA